MSRIQEILKKAERDGAVHRTRAAVVEQPRDERPVAALVEPLAAPAVVAERPTATRGFVEAPAVPSIDAPQVPIHVDTPVARPGGMLDPRLVAASAPQSLAAEQYRSLRTRISRAEHGRVLRALIITSPNKGDGKSLTAANLALTMAQEFNQRVLLLDADMRRPSLHRLFGIADTPGLSDVLMGGAALEEALVTIEDHRLTVLPSGMIPSHPAELLGSLPMRRLLETLRSRFDRIIIDMPPVSPLADVAIASSMADGVLMIVRAGVTPKPAIENALSGIESSKVLGLVLNDAGEAAGKYGYRGTYGGYRYVAG